MSLARSEVVKNAETKSDSGDGIRGLQVMFTDTMVPRNLKWVMLWLMAQCFETFFF